jgi:hypothetical protein
MRRWRRVPGKAPHDVDVRDVQRELVRQRGEPAARELKRSA